MIRDSIILHTPHDAVRSAALQKTNPTLEEVKAIAEAYEATQKSILLLKERNEPVIETNQLYSSLHLNKRKNAPRGRSHTRNRSKNGQQQQQHKSSTPQKSCSGCFIHHQKANCKFLNAICNKCGKKGHIAPVCLSFGSNSVSSFNYQRKWPTRNDHVNSLSEDNIFSVDDSMQVIGNKLFLTLNINNREVKFLLDTGASKSMIGLPGYNEINCPVYSKSTRRMKSYGGVDVPLLGEVNVNVKFNGFEQKLPLLITNMEHGDNIFGWDWAEAFGLRVNFDGGTNTSVLESVSPSDVDALCDKYPDLFATSLGHCNTVKAKLYLKSCSNPKYFKARPIPYAQLEAFKLEANRLEEEGIWKHIRFSEWAAPIVIVPKRNQKLRICGDFKVTINPQLEIDQYPIPRPEELFHKLSKGQYFSKLDMSDAYLQIELEEDSKKYAVVNTPLGLYQYQRLPFGIASAPAIFQRTLEAVLADIECAVYLDDILVTGKNMQEHLHNLEAVFKRLSDNGLRVNLQKCDFMKTEVEYLGHIVSAKGVRPAESKVAAIKKLPRPTNLKELQSFMGKINYYNSFIKNFSQIAAPLNELRKQDVLFQWRVPQENAFQNLKQQIEDATHLAHFKPELPIILATDASYYGIGAVISHLNPDGTEQPIAHASKTLNDSQRNYSQIEKEAFSIIFGVTKFRQYLYGRRFILYTDHKPLISLFHPNKKLPTITTGRLTRWALTLMSFTYEIRYKPSNKHANADALSRLPVGPDPEFDALEETCQEISSEIDENINDFPINAKDVAEETLKDAVLYKIKQYINKGWPEILPACEKYLAPYFNRRFSLTTQKGVILLQTDYNRVVIPNKLRDKILRMLHEGHWGIVRTKQLARRYCWWPQIDESIESNVKGCTICQTFAVDPPKEFHSWPQPEKPWERIHIDFAGPFLNQMWLICVDALSKFPFAISIKNTTSTNTIKALSRIFALEGLPEVIVSDNGTQFSSKEFDYFCNSNGIQHLRTAPFHPSSNGEAERFVRTFKTNMRKVCEEEKCIDTAVSKYLMTFRTTPNPVTGKSPAEILHGRAHRILLSQIVPNSKVNSQNSSCPKFTINQTVYVRNFAKGPKWYEGTVISQLGSITYLVRTPKGLWKRHQNQLRPRQDDVSPESFDTARILAQGQNSNGQIGKSALLTNNFEFSRNNQSQEPNSSSASQSPKAAALMIRNPSPAPVTPRRSTRIRKPIVRFQC
ncbi:uncharacterized protein K02A2.6-like [Eupeodes corollae]|uniref:uncharacterized protein K02A2.6-like n=1 Tax=Eupeodes corollae TaxID=290404 RepID=UPI002490E193|nr:uncharacterized protein K02A2.6-like [Eupeodes corollae]